MTTARAATVEQAAPPVVLEAGGIDMAFGGNKALDGATIKLRKGQWTGLIGPNGSGKTTLLNVVSGLYRPSAGRVVLNGEEVTGRRPRALARLGIVRTFQHPQMAADLTIFENVLLGGDLLKRRVGAASTTAGDRRGKAQALLTTFGCAEYVENQPDAVPYGVRKMAEIARALMADPVVLLLDEPAAGLSREERIELLRSLKEIRGVSPDLAVCLIEHDVRLVAAACELMQALNFGRSVAAGTSAEVLSDPQVRESYLGKRAHANKIEATP